MRDHLMSRDPHEVEPAQDPVPDRHRAQATRMRDCLYQVPYCRHGQERQCRCQSASSARYDAQTEFADASYASLNLRRDSRLRLVVGHDSPAGLGADYDATHHDRNDPSCCLGIRYVLIAHLRVLDADGNRRL